jgi:hypothetical protein
VVLDQAVTDAQFLGNADNRGDDARGIRGLEIGLGGEGVGQAYLKDKVVLPPRGHNPPFDPPFDGRLLDDLKVMSLNTQLVQGIDTPISIRLR